MTDVLIKGHLDANVHTIFTWHCEATSARED